MVLLADGGGRYYSAGAEGAGLAEITEGMHIAREDRFINWVRVNASPMVMGSKADSLTDIEELKAVLRRVAPGLLIPFLDGEKLVGLLLVGGSRRVRERRSEQFLKLFGAFAAILIRKKILDEEDRRMRAQQMRAENLANMGKVAAGIAHEIRNPLTFIRSAAEQLADSEAGQKVSSELTRGMVEEIDRVNRRIEELLSLRRVDTDVFESIEIEELIRGAARLVEAKAGERGVEIELSIDLNGEDVHGSEDRLRQLFLNLMLNAIEAMPEEGGGHLRIGAGRRDESVIVEFEDTGKGIPPEYADRVFEPFFTTKESGTGLGLAICFSVARVHGGTIELKRSGEEGSCFSVELPLAGARPDSSKHREQA
jgi:signal transduction histidine kinase